MKPSQRVSEFPNELVIVSAIGRLFCKACCKTLSVKRSTIVNHIKSSKHAESELNLGKKQSRELCIADDLHKYDKASQPKGQTLPSDQQVYRKSDDDPITSWYTNI